VTSRADDQALKRAQVTKHKEVSMSPRQLKAIERAIVVLECAAEVSEGLDDMEDVKLFRQTVRRLKKAFAV